MTAPIRPWADSHQSSDWPLLRNVSTSETLAKGDDYPPSWRRIAKESRFRLADYYQPLSTKGIRRTLDKLGLTSEDFQDFYGEITYAKFVEMNPTTPLWAFQGMTLEAIQAFRASS